MQTGHFCVLLPLSYNSIKHIFVGFIGIILLNTFVTFFIIYVSIKCLNKQRAIISNQTYKVKKNFFKYFIV